MTEYSRETLKTDLQETGLEQLSRGKAIRAKCLDCCCGSPSEVARCHIVKCPLWPFRFGTNPFTTRTGNPGAIDALAKARAQSKKDALS